MTRLDTVPAPAALRVIRAVAGALLWLWLACAGPARAQGIDLSTFELTRADGALLLDFVAKPALGKAVEDASRAAFR